MAYGAGSRNRHNIHPDSPPDICQFFYRACWVMDGQGDQSLALTGKGQSEDYDNGSDNKNDQSTDDLLSDLFSSKDRTVGSNIRYDARYDALLGALGPSDQEIQFNLNTPTSTVRESRSSKRHRLKRVCFNCQLEGHLLSACPLPFDRNRVNQARKAYDEEKDSLRSKALQQSELDSERSDDDESENNEHIFQSRFWAADVEIATRLDMATKFKPGAFSRPLKLALGNIPDDQPTALYPTQDELGKDIWRGMLVWGYPPGYYSVRDPQESILDRINHKDEPQEDGVSQDREISPALLNVFDESSEIPNEFGLHMFKPASDNMAMDDIDVGSHVEKASTEDQPRVTLSPSSSHHRYSSSSPPPPPSSPSSSTQFPLPVSTSTRWVAYPTTSFSSVLLPVFHLSKPFPLPPIASDPVHFVSPPSSAPLTTTITAMVMRTSMRIDLGSLPVYQCAQFGEQSARTIVLIVLTPTQTFEMNRTGRVADVTEMKEETGLTENAQMMKIGKGGESGGRAISFGILALPFKLI
ncbi:Zinc finger, CCHC-type [Phaffia rhodozyma]|uniref:Zinc finger, CCHC-type n=1 Tax=Phaffia rhodozyma TaxID=264483 RepID=A0A0F7SNE5_PHARH|nr:Zinc finger, CCHC-type [Phaffia rhodozyma]